MSSLEKGTDRDTNNTFNKKIVSASQQLHSYVKHRLYIAESTGILPKNMYSSNDIIDDSITKFYGNGYDANWDIDAIKLKLFALASKELDVIYKKEAFHQKTVSTNSTLEKELDGLDENYTVDSDLDFIMNEELNDISYHQPDKHNHVFIYADHDNSILNAFDMEHVSVVKSQKALGSLYSWLPFNISNILDLYVFGKLDFEDIAKVMNMETSRVAFIFDEISNKFKDHID